MKLAAAAPIEDEYVTVAISKEANESSKEPAIKLRRTQRKFMSEVMLGGNWKLKMLEEKFPHITILDLTPDKLILMDSKLGEPTAISFKDRLTEYCSVHRSSECEHVEFAKYTPHLGIIWRNYSIHEAGRDVGKRREQQQKDKERAA